MFVKSHRKLKQIGDRVESVTADAFKDFAWIDPRWILGTTEAFCSRCGLRIIFPSANAAKKMNNPIITILNFRAAPFCADGSLQLAGRQSCATRAVISAPTLRPTNFVTNSAHAKLFSASAGKIKMEQR
jgi:hypothetical protein